MTARRCSECGRMVDADEARFGYASRCVGCVRAAVEAERAANGDDWWDNLDDE
jgi:hypothetical protein